MLRANGTDKEPEKAKDARVAKAEERTAEAEKRTAEAEAKFLKRLEEALAQAQSNLKETPVEPTGPTSPTSAWRASKVDVLVPQASRSDVAKSQNHFLIENLIRNYYAQAEIRGGRKATPEDGQKIVMPPGTREAPVGS